MILIHPPVSKPSEPPIGIAHISAALSAHGVRHYLLDANLEGLLHLLHRRHDPADTWTRRAQRNLSRNLAALKDLGTYTNMDRYRRAVLELNRLLHTGTDAHGARVSLADYTDAALSPLRSDHLLWSADHPEENIFYPYFRDRIVGLFEEAQPSHVGFSLNYLSQALSTFAMVGFIKRDFPGVKLVLGGSLVTSWLRGKIWSSSLEGLVDHAVAGPGESFLLSLAGVADGRPGTLPSYESLPLDNYLSPGRILPYSTSRGCYWNKCSFCPERAEGNRYAQGSPGRVAADLTTLTQRLRPALIHITDNAVSPAMMHALCANPPGPPWYGFARITPQLTDDDFCRALKDSGCVMLKLGLESGDQGLLDLMNKGIAVSVMSRALRSLKRAGIAVYGYLLFGTPFESEHEARETLSFVVSHSNTIDFLNVALFNLPRNSPDTGKVKTKDFYEGDLSLYTDFLHTRDWSRRKVRLFLKNEFNRHPAVRPILKRRLPHFTSNHAPFFVM